jgi:hypothetical protein
MLRTQLQVKLCFKQVFFLIAFPLGTFLRSACFSPFSLCGVAGLRGTFLGHPRPPSLLLSPFSGRHNTNTTTHNIHGRPPSGLGFEPC